MVILSDSEASEDETVNSQNVSSARRRVSSESGSSDHEVRSNQERTNNPNISDSDSERSQGSGDEGRNRSRGSDDERGRDFNRERITNPNLSDSGSERSHGSDDEGRNRGSDDERGRDSDSDNEAKKPASDNEAGEAAPNNENKDDPDKKDDPPKKKRVKREVLNTARLKGPRGVHTIEKLFEGFKYKGKGHEKEDLDRVMKRMEYWAFRLYPKLDFDDFIDKVESLSNKKDLLPFLKKYRYGMLTEDDEIRPENMAEEEEEDRNEMNNDGRQEGRQNELMAQIQQQNEQFDALFADEF